MSALEFTAETHEYQLNGQPVPSVTTVLHDAGFIDTRFMTELGRWRGSYCHAAAELHDLGDLDESSLRPEMTPYLDAWKRFRMETGFVPVDIEKKVYSERYGYAGTLDRTGTLRSGRRVILDIKTGTLLDYCRLQLAAYLSCLDQPFLYDRMAVRITSKGKYSCKLYPVEDYTRDRDQFLHALQTTRG